MPVEYGAGRIRILTGTPLCRPTPAASTGRWMVVSNLKCVLHHFHAADCSIPAPNHNSFILHILAGTKCCSLATLNGGIVAEMLRPPCRDIMRAECPNQSYS